MTDCKNLNAEDVTPWHCDVFDHPDYKYICRLTGKEVIPCIRCNENKCKNYEPLEHGNAEYYYSHKQ